MRSQATFDAALAPGLPVQMAPARQAALTWWAVQSRETAWCDQCCRALAWGEGYLLPAALARKQPHEDKATPADWLVCERCLYTFCAVGARHDSARDEESPDE